MKSLHALGAHIAAFGFKPKYVVMFVVRVAIQLSMVVSLALDRLLLPGLTRTTLDRPIFLIGHLRSGTTFLHRFLLRSCPELRGLLMWEMLCPSVIGRWLTRPMRSWLGRVSLDAVYDPAIHETGLLTAETDDIALALRFNDGLLSWIYNDAWTEPPSETAVRAEVRSASRSRAFPAYLRGVYQRVAWRGPNRILSKSFYGLFCVDHIRELFPGARLLLLIRDPAEAVPSMMSLQRSVQGALHDHEANPELAARYYRNLYQASLAYYTEFHRVASTETDSVIVVTHRQLLERFDETFLRICAAMGIEETKKLKEKISDQVSSQRAHHSSHVYESEEFGISPSDLARDFAFVYDNYEV